MKKICSKCKLSKAVSCFTKTQKTKDGIYQSCKQCQKEYRIKNKDKISAYNKSKSEEKKIYMLEWRAKNKDSQLEYYKRTYQENIEKRRQYFKDNRESRKIKERIYIEKNKDKRAEYVKKYYQKNKDILNKKLRDRKNNDPIFKLKAYLRTRIYFILKKNGYGKSKTSEQIIGVTFDILKKHIERQFTKGMTWENYGEWHIDHKIPLDSAKSEEDIIKLCHYSNLQPLWGGENISKSNKIFPTQTNLPI